MAAIQGLDYQKLTNLDRVGRNVCVWPFASFRTPASNDRSWSNNGHWAAQARNPSVAFDPTATSTDTITFPSGGEHEAAGVSSDAWLGGAAYMTTPTTIIGQARIAALSIQRAIERQTRAQHD